MRSSFLSSPDGSAPTYKHLSYHDADDNLSVFNQVQTNMEVK